MSCDCDGKLDLKMTKSLTELLPDTQNNLCGQVEAEPGSSSVRGHFVTVKVTLSNKIETLGNVCLGCTQ